MLLYIYTEPLCAENCLCASKVHVYTVQYGNQILMFGRQTEHKEKQDICTYGLNLIMWLLYTNTDQYIKPCRQVSYNTIILHVPLYLNLSVSTTGNRVVVPGSNPGNSHITETDFLYTESLFSLTLFF